MGGADSKLLAMFRASWVIFPPLLCGTAASDTLTVPEGWTEKTNSSVPRTPSGRSGTSVSFSISLVRSHGGTWPGRTRILRAPRTFRVFVLKYRSDLDGTQRSLSIWACLWIRSSKSRIACGRESSGTSGLKALLPASMIDSINFCRPFLALSLAVCSMVRMTGDSRTLGRPRSTAHSRGARK